ncbi:HNH endonuclease [Candidatus Saccharibacteria bacterium]|nr:HNH endonuclease [Candidatus Saccharibacteria bacterium]
MIYRFTGLPENWITGIGLNMWALNEKNKGIWDKLEPGDIALLHSTSKSDYGRSKTVSAVIGYARISNKKWITNDPTWMQEKASGEIMWPYAFKFDQILLFNDMPRIEFNKDNMGKSRKQLDTEVQILSASGIPLSRLNRMAKERDPNVPGFPINGSSSRVNPIYEEIILTDRKELFSFSGDADDMEIAEEIGDIYDPQIAEESIDVVKKKAVEFKQTKEGYARRAGISKIRIDNEVQKRRIARLQDHTCQVCGFYCEYVRKNGRKGWIIEVDHIIDKNKGGTEEAGNLWALCPNCHAKKTRGVIVIDPVRRVVTQDGEVVSIRDGHLGWQE